jgi:hypothetical protein
MQQLDSKGRLRFYLTLKGSSAKNTDIAGEMNRQINRLSRRRGPCLSSNLIYRKARRFAIIQVHDLLISVVGVGCVI